MALEDGRVMDAASARFTPVFVEKDDEPEMVARFGIDYYPTFVFTDAAGEEAWRSAQPLDSDELLDEVTAAIESLDGALDD